MLLKRLFGKTRKAVNVVKDLKRFSFNSWDLGVFAWIFGEGRLLLTETPGGNYSLPGGGVEHADTVDYKKANANFPFLEPLKREVREETNAEIISVDGATTLLLPRRGFILSNLALFVLVTDFKGRVAASGVEIENARFFNKFSAQKKLHGRMKIAAMRAFEVYIEERIKVNLTRR